MDDPISARYQWKPDEMAEGLTAHYRLSTRPIFRVKLTIYLLAGIGVPIWLITSRQAQIVPDLRRNAAISLVAIILIWGIAVSGICDLAFMKWRARKAFRSLPGGSSLVEWSFRRDHISSRTDLAASTLLWPSFLKVVETPKGFLMYQQVDFFNWIPGYAFASAGELIRFTELARARSSDFVRMGGCQYVGKPDPTGLDDL